MTKQTLKEQCPGCNPNNPELEIFRLCDECKNAVEEVRYYATENTFFSKLNTEQRIENKIIISSIIKLLQMTNRNSFTPKEYDRVAQIKASLFWLENEM